MKLHLIQMKKTAEKQCDDLIFGKAEHAKNKLTHVGATKVITGKAITCPVLAFDKLHYQHSIRQHTLDPLLCCERYNVISQTLLTGCVLQGH